MNEILFVGLGDLRIDNYEELPEIINGHILDLSESNYSNKILVALRSQFPVAIFSIHGVEEMGERLQIKFGTRFDLNQELLSIIDAHLSMPGQKVLEVWQ